MLDHVSFKFRLPLTTKVVPEPGNLWWDSRGRGKLKYHDCPSVALAHTSSKRGL